MAENQSKYNSIVFTKIHTGGLKIGVDFDGVLMKLCFGRSWVIDDQVNGNGPYNLMKKTTDILSSIIAFYTRKHQEHVSESLEELSKNNELILITSRRNYVKNISLRWLELKGIKKYFSGFYFRDINISPSGYKDKVIKEKNIDVHIDDNYPTVELLSNNNPDKYFVYLSPEKRDIPRSNVYNAGSWDEIRNLLK